MISAYKFIQKFWVLNEELSEITKLKQDKKNEELEFFLIK